MTTQLEILVRTIIQNRAAFAPSTFRTAIAVARYYALTPEEVSRLTKLTLKSSQKALEELRMHQDYYKIDFERLMAEREAALRRAKRKKSTPRSRYDVEPISSILDHAMETLITPKEARILLVLAAAGPATLTTIASLMLWSPVRVAEALWKVRKWHRYDLPMPAKAAYPVGHFVRESILYVRRRPPGLPQTSLYK